MTKIYNSSNDLYDDINFVTKRAVIFNKEGKPIFDKIVVFPDYFSDNAVNIVASKYFYNSHDDKKSEVDIRSMTNRVADTIAMWGVKQKYFENEEQSIVFSNKLKHYQIRQMFCFNSPVYFNMGINEKVQASACFILEIEDNMESITNAMCVESKIFKKGSGSGMNLSNIRSKYESINNEKGNASGPVSFLKVHDLQGSVIKSGGSLRRSAKIAVLNDSHPDIEDFIECKKFEEEKLHVLMDAGIKPQPGRELSDEVFYQSTNFSVGISDDFMNSVISDSDWYTRFVTDPRHIHKTYKARELLYKIAKCAWEMGDPGLQFLDTVNNWNTVLNDGRIVSSNPCGEFYFLNNSSCNLAAINLIKFFNKTESGYEFDFELFKDVIETVITAQDIIVDGAVYPTEKITNNSSKYRPLGLGFTNLGGLLMYLGLAYDSEEGRNLASGVTALMTGISYLTSNRLGYELGSFEYFERNKSSFYSIMNKHHDALMNRRDNFKDNKFPIIKDLYNLAAEIWDKILLETQNDGKFRNAQVTLLMPTGTTSHLLGAQTTGIEPEFSHVKYKRLSNTDGGTIKMTSDVVKTCLENLGYKDNEVNEIECFIKDDKPLDLCRCLQKEHIKILDTSNGNIPNQVIHYTGHINMLAATQPFISGGTSKTISFPNNCTIEDIFKCYIECWKLGLKGVTVYRDGSKNYQPLSTSNKIEVDIDDIEDDDIPNEFQKDERLVKYMHSMLAKRALPEERPAINHKFSVDRVKGFLNMGMFDNGDLGEVFINISKEGSTLSGLLDCLGTVTSISLQRGVPLKEIVEKMIWQKFEPAGWTSNQQIRTATSIVDYIFKYIGLRFLSKEDQLELGLISPSSEEHFDGDDEEIQVSEKNKLNIQRSLSNNFAGSGKICDLCGSIMVIKGTCFTCMNCATNYGSCG